MRISKLRRTLAVFLSALMITLCVPFSGITASAETIASVTLSYSGTLPTKLIAGENHWDSINLENFSVSGCTIATKCVGDSSGNRVTTSYVANEDYYVYLTIRSISPDTLSPSTSANVDIENQSLQQSKISFIYNSGLKGQIKYYLGRAQSAECTISFNANGGTVSQTSATTVNSKLSSLPEPTRPGFKFLGWYDSETGGTKVTTSTTFSSNTTIYAHWEHIAHNWRYSASGNVITANCFETACKYNTTGATLTLNASDANYTGSPYTGASVSYGDGFPVSAGDISYVGHSGTSYEESTTAPTKVGSYMAIVTAGEKKATKMFNINALTMTGVYAPDVTKTYDGNAYGIEVTGVPDGAVLKYGESQDSCTLEESPKYTDAGTYWIFYKVTKENYADFINSARLIINRADYTGEKTAEAQILAREVNEDLTVTLPAIPENMSYGTPTSSMPVTAASVADGVLTFSTDNNSMDSQDYYIYVPVNGTGANYQNYEITVTLTAKACPHTNKETDWTADENGHWHKCPGCTAKVDYEAHSFTDYVYDGNADCLNDGTKTAVCDKEGCNATHTVTDTGTALGHDWSDEFTNDDTHHWHECVRDNCPGIADNSDKDGYEEHTPAAAVEENRVEPTCTEDGSFDEVVYCSKCHYEISRTNRTLDKSGHSFTDYVSDGNADCLNDGTKTAECDNGCGETDTVTDTGTALGHDWSDEFTNDDTHHWHECVRDNCPGIANDSEKDGYEEHTPADAVEENRVEATCTEDGSFDEVVYCSKCHYEISRTKRTLDKSGHSFTDYVSDGNADCLNDGTKTAQCDNGCGETDTVADTGSATGHKWSTKYTYDKQHHWHECENTGCPVTDNTGKDGYAEHISSGAATEDNDEHCTVCGYVINPPLDHLCGRTELKFVPYAAETCTTDGVKAHYVCRCGKLYSDKAATTEVTAEDVRIPAHHTWSEEWTKTATHHYHLCTACGEKNDNAPHAYGEWTITKPASIGENGEKERICGICGYVQKGTVQFFPDDNDSETGDISNVTDPEDNACHGDIEISQYEIIENFELTDEELSAVENGENINVYLTVDDITAGVPAEDKAAVESVLGFGEKTAMYLDINLFKQIGNNAPSKVTELSGDITVVLEIPEKYISHDKDFFRDFFIVRVHNGKAEKIRGTFNSVTRKLEFRTDKFSAYAIAYKDISTANPNPAPTPDKTPDPAPDTNPDTAPDHGHSHDYKQKHDETGHWKECSCGDKKDLEEHSFGEWETVREASEGEDELVKHTCTVCGYSETLPVDDVSAGEGLSIENGTLHSDTDDVLLIFISASSALAAAAYIVRRKLRQ